MSRLRIALIVLFVGFIAYNSLNDADRDESGEIVSGGDMSAFSVRVGDCFNDPPEILDGGQEIMDVGAVPCVEPHDNEVYAQFDLSLGAYPGDEEISVLAYDRCMESFESFVGISYAESILDILRLTPTAESWSQQNDREVSCAVYNIELEKLTGSMRGSGI